LHPYSSRTSVIMNDHDTIPLCKRPMAVANLANPFNKQSRRKRFRFAPEMSQVVGTVLSRDDFTVEENRNYWWSKEKTLTFRSAACTVIETARANKDENTIYLIDDSYKFAKDVAGCLKDDAIEDILRDPSLHTRRLEVWSTKGQEVCGLERMISQLQQLERRADYLRLRRYVVNTSKTTRTVEEIADVATRLSLTSRVYARMVGHAEAHILPPSQRKAVRYHTMEVAPESKAPTVSCTRKILPPPKQSTWRRPKQSTWRRLMRRGKALVTV
jgi:hypothetical protein